MSKETLMASMKDNIVQFTNEKLVHWYKEAKNSYGVDGYGECRFIDRGEKMDNDEAQYDFVVKYVENGVAYTAVMTVCDEYLIQNELTWLYNIWQENGMIVAKDEDLKEAVEGLKAL